MVVPFALLLPLALSQPPINHSTISPTSTRTLRRLLVYAASLEVHGGKVGLLVLHLSLFYYLNLSAKIAPTLANF